MKNFLILAFAAFIIKSCAADKKETTFEDKLVIHALSDAKGLHPTNVTDSRSSEMGRYLFQKLLSVDFETNKLTPWLAKQLPTLEITNLGNGNQGMNITYELRPDAKWDNGTPITVADVEFSFKVIKNPKTEAHSKRPHLDYIIDFVTYSDNPYKFTFVCNKTYMLWDHATGNIAWIIPKYIYDPDGLMDDISFKDIVENNTDKLESEANLNFAKNFNDVKYHREKGFVVGSGPYQFVEWKTNQRITLKRKANWWGSTQKAANVLFENGPQTIVYETINDMTTALTALKGGHLDVIVSLQAKQWVNDVANSEKIKNNYNKFEPLFPTYTYIGLNMRSPILSGKKTRQALAHCVDADKIKKKLLYDLPNRTVGPIQPFYKADYASELPLYNLNIEKAKQLLKDDGWEDTDGNGIVDKIIDGKKVEFKLNYSYNQGNDTRKKVGILLKEGARQAGIDISLVSMEWSVFIERLKKHELDLWYNAWGTGVKPNDPKQIWHTESYNGGSNFTGFGTAETDALIEKIRTEMDAEKRSELYHQWQAILHDEVPYIFMFTNNRRILIHKRFTNLNIGAKSPGYWGGGFQLAPGFNVLE